MMFLPAFMSHFKLGCINENMLKKYKLVLLTVKLFYVFEQFSWDTTGVMAAIKSWISFSKLEAIVTTVSTE